jgi:hypothetical protein
MQKSLSQLAQANRLATGVVCAGLLVTAHIAGVRHLTQAGDSIRAELARVEQARADWLPQPFEQLAAVSHAQVADYASRVERDLTPLRARAQRIARGSPVTFWLNARRASASSALLARIDAEVTEAAAARVALRMLEQSIARFSDAERRLAEAHGAARDALVPVSELADFDRVERQLVAAASEAVASGGAIGGVEAPSSEMRAQDYFVAMSTGMSQGLTALRAEGASIRTAVRSARAALDNHQSDALAIAADVAPRLATLAARVEGLNPTIAGVRSRMQPLEGLLRRAREPLARAQMPDALGDVLAAVNSMRRTPLTPADIVEQISPDAGLILSGLGGLVGGIDSVQVELSAMRRATAQCEAQAREFVEAGDRRTLMRLAEDAPVAVEYLRSRASIVGAPARAVGRLRPQLERLRETADGIPAEPVAAFVRTLADGAEGAIDAVESPFESVERDMLAAAGQLDRVAVAERSYRTRLEQLRAGIK